MKCEFIEYVNQSSIYENYLYITEKSYYLCQEKVSIKRKNSNHTQSIQKLT